MKLEDMEVGKLVRKIKKHQQETLSLIASESITSAAILKLAGSNLNNKNITGNHVFPGTKWVNDLENLAVERAKQLFGAEHANVQPHSGSNANLEVYAAVLKIGDTILAMDLAAGGHPSHAHSPSVSAQFYRLVTYGLNRDTELIDYEEMLQLARKHQPKLIIGGSTSYPRLFDWRKMRAIADEVSSFLMADIAHPSGLVAAKVIPSPIPYADFVTSTCYKTLLGPKGGFILCKKNFSDKIDRAVCPGFQSAEMLNFIAGKAVCFKQAMTQEFITVQHQIVKNSRALAECMKAEGFRIVTNGTDNHCVVVDLRKWGIKGIQAQKALEEIGILVNKRLIPYDPEPYEITSGLRIGTSVVTSRGMKEEEMHLIAELISKRLSQVDNVKAQSALKKEVLNLCKRFPIPY